MADKRATAVQAELVAHVRATALQRYNEGFGWSVIVEAWDDAQIVEEIGEARTPDGAIRKVLPTVKLLSDVYDDRAADARNSAF